MSDAIGELLRFYEQTAGLAGDEILYQKARAELRHYQAIEQAAEEMAKGTNFLMEYMKDNDLIDCCCDDGDPTTGMPGITCEYHIAELTLADYRKAKEGK